MAEDIKFDDRPAQERVIGILSVIKEPLPAEQVAKYAKVTPEEVVRIAKNASNGIEASGGANETLYMASAGTRARQADLKWAHEAIALSILARIPGFGGGRYEGR